MQLGEEMVYLANRLQSTVKRSQSMSSRQEFRDRNWNRDHRRTLISFLIAFFSWIAPSTFLTQPRPNWPGMILPKVSWAHTHQSSLKNMPHRHACRSIWWWKFLRWSFLFLSMSRTKSMTIPMLPFPKSKYISPCDYPFILLFHTKLLSSCKIIIANPKNRLGMLLAISNLNVYIQAMFLSIDPTLITENTLVERH